VASVEAEEFADPGAGTTLLKREIGVGKRGRVKKSNPIE